MAKKKKPVETRNCEYCDKEFRIGKGFGGYRRRFCDQKCSIAFRSSRKYHAPGLKEGYDYTFASHGRYCPLTHLFCYTLGTLEDIFQPPKPI